MSKVHLWLLTLLASAAGALVEPQVALGQPYPSKPIRLVIPWAPGGGGDLVGRPIAHKLSELMGQPVIVENRPGASGVIGASVVAKAEPDGYTLMLTFDPPHNTTPLFSKNVPYDTVKDFTPIILVVTGPQVVVVHPSFAVHSMTELVAYAKGHPGKISYGTAGRGTGQHLAGELLAFAAGIDMVHVPYKGGAPAVLNDLLADRIPMAILTLSGVKGHIQAGKLRALGVVEAKRPKAMPSIPTISEAGVSGYAAPYTWIGFLGPAGLPQPIVKRLNAEVRKAINAPDVRARIEGIGFEVYGNTPEEFERTIAESVKVYRKLAADARIEPE